MRLLEPADLRARIPDVNDGIIAIAGVVEGFIVAGAGPFALGAAAVAATIAGAASLAGTTYAETAADRDAQLAIIAEERASLERDPEAELAELAERYEARGVEAELAREVARQVSAHDALTAQLETEYGILEPMSRAEPYLTAAAAAAAFALGAGVPLLIIWAVPWNSHGVVTAIAVLLSLIATAVIAARLGHASVGRTVVRSLVVGLIALGLSILVGHAIPDPDGDAPQPSAVAEL